MQTSPEHVRIWNGANLDFIELEISHGVLPVFCATESTGNVVGVTHNDGL